MLEVADNLERALSSSAEEQQQASADTAMAQLKSLRGGLNLTQKILMQVSLTPAKSASHQNLKLVLRMHLLY